MKKLTILLALLVPMIAFGQDVIKPQFPGGEEELSSFVKANFKIEETYLTLAKNKYTMMTCKIDVTGKMYGIEVEYTQIINTAKNDINTELKRVLMLAAEKYTWVPAETDGKKVEAEQIITFVFDKDGAINTRIGTAINDGVEVAKEDPYTLQNKLRREEMSKADSTKKENTVEEQTEEVEWVEMEQVEEEEELIIFDEPMIEAEEEVEVEVEVDVYSYDIVPEPEMRIEEEVFEIYQVSEKPEFPGGEQALKDFIYSNLTLSKAAIENGVNGRVYLQFTVNKNGKLEDISLVRDGVGYGCYEEAIRVLKLMNEKYTWEPGKIRGKDVKVKYILPIDFNSDNYDSETGRHKDYK